LPVKKEAVGEVQSSWSRGGCGGVTVEQVKWVQGAIEPEKKVVASIAGNRRKEVDPRLKVGRGARTGNCIMDS